MNDLAWVCAAIVGVVFVWAGVTKLQSRVQWASQARNMGAPMWVSGPLPFLEIALGSALVLDWWTLAVVPTALVLLAAFTALIGRNLLMGKRPPCACLGVRSNRPISWWSVVRNLVFGALLLIALLVD